MAAGSKTPPVEDVAEPEVVKYVGTADEARISASDWKKANVEEQDQVVFNQGNNFQVKTSDLSAGALEALSKDSRFKVPSKG